MEHRARQRRPHSARRTADVLLEDGTQQWDRRIPSRPQDRRRNLLSRDGSKEWQKTYGVDGQWTWQLFDAAGKQTAESHWGGKTLVDYNFSEAK